MSRGVSVCISCAHRSVCKSNDGGYWESCTQYLALSAFHPVSRGQIKKEWVPCSQCKPFIDMDMESFSVGTVDGRVFDVNYCTKCGRPMSDAAWDEWGQRVGQFQAMGARQ